MSGIGNNMDLESARPRFISQLCLSSPDDLSPPAAGGGPVPQGHLKISVWEWGGGVCARQSDSGGQMLAVTR